VIELKELTKYYGEKKAVGPLTVTIDKGEVIGLLGRNGAGKTTTLRMLSSDLLPTSGRMTVDGVDLVEEPERVRPRIGYLPDRPPLYDEMEVTEYLTFAARLRGMPSGRIGKRVDAVVDRCSLGSVAFDRIGTLSHGFRQRVGIGQAIVHEPRLLLLDEPISGLDPVQIVEMRELIRALRGEHTTVLSSHILSEIEQTCDRLLVIDDGVVIAAGAEAELTSQVMAELRVDVTVRGPKGNGAKPADAVRALVGKIEGVKSVRELPVDEPGERVVKLRIDCESDVREELCRALVAADCGLMAMVRSARSELEKVFMELTAKGASGGRGS
jgi:ABC-2 type transport system ATP-binding protein